MDNENLINFRIIKVYSVYPAALDSFIKIKKIVGTFTFDQVFKFLS